MAFNPQMKTSLFALLLLVCCSCGNDFSALQTPFPDDVGASAKPVHTIETLAQIFNDPVFHPKPGLP